VPPTTAAAGAVLVKVIVWSAWVTVCEKAPDVLPV
jgi:hypothetical protein